MSQPQIEITVAVDDNGLREVKLIDRPDYYSQVPVNSTDDAVIMAYVQGTLDTDQLQAICNYATALQYDHAVDCAERIGEQCEALESLACWFLNNRYRLTDTQVETWHDTESDGMFARSPYENEWCMAVNELTKLRTKFGEEE